MFKHSSGAWNRSVIDTNNIVSLYPYSCELHYSCKLRVIFKIYSYSYCPWCEQALWQEKKVLHFCTKYFWFYYNDPPKPLQTGSVAQICPTGSTTITFLSKL